MFRIVLLVVIAISFCAWGYYDQTKDMPSEEERVISMALSLENLKHCGMIPHDSIGVAAKRIGKYAVRVTLLETATRREHTAVYVLVSAGSNSPWPRPGAVASSNSC